MTTLFVLFGGIDYEGSYPLSVHATYEDAVRAVDEIVGPVTDPSTGPWCRRPPSSDRPHRYDYLHVLALAANCGPGVRVLEWRRESEEALVRTEGPVHENRLDPEGRVPLGPDEPRASVWQDVWRRRL